MTTLLLPFNFPILSVRQPYAHQIIFKGKNVENRTWRPYPSYFGPLYIHAAKTFETKFDKEEFLGFYPDGKIGGVIGVVGVVGYKRPYQYPSIWTNPDAKWLWILENPQPIDFVPMKGELGLFYRPNLVEEEKEITSGPSLRDGITYVRYA